MSLQEVELFISEDCDKECHQLIQFFQDRRIPYLIRNISKDKKWMKKMHDQHVYITPVVFYGNFNYILGYQQSKLKEIFGSSN